MFDVILSEEALEDLNDVLDFYSNISFALAQRFLKNFDKCLLQLEDFPFFQICYDEIRLRQIKKFPIILHFIIREDKALVIYGVCFAQQNPENYPKI